MTTPLNDTPQTHPEEPSTGTRTPARVWAAQNARRAKREREEERIRQRYAQLQLQLRGDADEGQEDSELEQLSMQVASTTPNPSQPAAKPAAPVVAPSSVSSPNHPVRASHMSRPQDYLHAARSFEQHQLAQGNSLLLDRDESAPGWLDLQRALGSGGPFARVGVCLGFIAAIGAAGALVVPWGKLTKCACQHKISATSDAYSSARQVATPVQELPLESPQERRKRLLGL